VTRHRPNHSSRSRNAPSKPATRQLGPNPCSFLPRDLTIQGPQRYNPSPHPKQPVHHLSGAVATSTDTEQVVLVHVPLLWQLHARRQGGACVGTQSTPCGQEGRGSKHGHIFGRPCSPQPVAKPDTQTAATHYTTPHTMTHTESPEARLPVRIAPTPRCTWPSSPHHMMCAWDFQCAKTESPFFPDSRKEAKHKHPMWFRVPAHASAACMPCMRHNTITLIPATQHNPCRLGAGYAWPILHTLCPAGCVCCCYALVATTHTAQLKVAQKHSASPAYCSLCMLLQDAASGGSLLLISAHLQPCTCRQLPPALHAAAVSCKMAC